MTPVIFLSKTINIILHVNQTKKKIAQLYVDKVSYENK